MKNALKSVNDELIRRVEKSGIKGRTVTLKIKFSDFTQQTRSKTVEHFPEADTIWELAQELLNQEEIPKPVRLLGLGLSNLNITEDVQYFGEQLKIPFES